MAESGNATYLNLEDAWGDIPFPMRSVNLRSWGPRLRYIGTRADVEAFWEAVRNRLGPFVLYGSGDFHYLAGVLLRRVPSPVTLISFDNHPDWDIRPPHWACGGWINRALELSNVRRAVIWGCGNFELAMPSRLFANHRALRVGRLEVHAWAERQNAGVRRHFDCMTRENWRERFERFAGSLAGQEVYVTVDLDCLRKEEAVTNWENGLFTAQDVVWALSILRAKARVVAGDLCGAYSPPAYARGLQRFAGWWDHPKQPPVKFAVAQQINRSTLEALWPALTGA
jgi:arginase family enzyme